MTFEQTIENAELIAKFLGWKLSAGSDNLYEIPIKQRILPFFGEDAYTPAQMRWHSDWNWLIMVLSKIEHQGCIIETWISLASGCRIMKPTNNPIVITAKENNSYLQAVYDSVIEYIKWYNTQTIQ